MSATMENASIQAKPEHKASTLNPCTCQHCTATVHHWFCDGCKRGPLNFTTDRPFQRRLVQHPKTKAVIGCRYACSIGCYEKEQLARIREARQIAVSEGRTEQAKQLTVELEELKAAKAKKT